jgi:hypothetical protein
VPDTGGRAEEPEPSAEAAPPEEELTDTDVEETVAAEEPEPQTSGEGETGMPSAAPEEEPAADEVLIGTDVERAAEPVHETAPVQDSPEEEGPSAA